MLNGVTHEVRYGAQAELIHDVVLVKFDCADGDADERGDLLAHFAGSEELENFLLAGGEGITCPIPWLAAGREGEGGRQVRLTTQDSANGGGEFFSFGFENVALGAGAEGGADIGGAIMTAQDDDGAVGEVGGEAGGGFDAIGGGHGDVSDDDIGAQIEGQFEKVAPVAGNAEDFKFPGKNGADAFGNDAVVIGEKYPDWRSWGHGATGNRGIHLTV